MRDVPAGPERWPARPLPRGKPAVGRERIFSTRPSILACPYGVQAPRANNRSHAPTRLGWHGLCAGATRLERGRSSSSVVARFFQTFAEGRWADRRACPAVPAAAS